MTSPGTAPDCITGLDENSSEATPYRYDPVLKLLSFDADYRGSVTIFDSLGRTLWNTTYTQAIDLSQWTGELLLFQFESGSGFGLGRIIVE